MLRLDDFPIPKKISDEDFDELCATCHIPSAHKQDTKRRLDDLVESFTDWMSDHQRQPNRRSDRKRLSEALEHVREAAAEIDRLGPSGRLALKAIAPSLARMLAARWMNESFPGDGDVPQLSALPPASKMLGMRVPTRASYGTAKYFIEEKSLEARFYFVRRHPARTISAALKEIERGLIEAIRACDQQPGSRGGRKRLTFRHFLIVNLAEMWFALGRWVSTGPKSEFVAFCDSVAVSIGWPSDGLSSAVPAAVTDWRNRSRKNYR